MVHTPFLQILCMTRSEFDLIELTKLFYILILGIDLIAWLDSVQACISGIQVSCQVPIPSVL